MEIGLLIFSLLVVSVTLRRGRRSQDSCREFPQTGLYANEEGDSPNLYGEHRANHLYPDPAKSGHGEAGEGERSKAS